MESHDPLCPMHPGWHEGWDGSDSCALCDVIAEVRADERERIAVAIEALPFNPELGAGGYVLEHWVRQSDAARIARKGGFGAEC